MARHIFAACGALAIAGVALSAQSTTPSPSSTAAQPQSAAGTVTIQGCLKPSASAPMGSTPSGTTPGATGTSGAGATQFLLTDAKMGSGSSSAPSGATGTAGAAGAKDDEYVLRAESASVNLAAHLNHQIEITGRLASSGSTATGTTPGATGATGTSSTSRQTVTVTAVKMIAAECK